MMQKKDFQEELEERIKEAGEELIRRASDIAHESDLLKEMTIYISFDSAFTCVPTIDVTKTYICKTTYSKLTDTFTEKKNN